ncbi:hypothetical protein DL93DRAFT_2171452 [Clavulina sp. PMI_390]|nr:hypothetical protein DL93DRAFT_2171452 [Clavulina sp. PMI_390]
MASPNPSVPSVHYRIFQNHVPVSVRQNGRSEFGLWVEESVLIGKLLPEHIPPPRTAKMLKGYIANVEGFSAGDVEDIYLPGAKSSMWNSERLDLSTTAPGSDETSPFEVIIRDGAPRAARRPPPYTTNTDPALWTTAAEPKLFGTTGWLLASAMPPSPWRRAHSFPERKRMFVQMDPKVISYDSVRIPERALLYVDTRKPLRKIQDYASGVTEDQYRVILVAEGIVGLCYHVYQDGQPLTSHQSNGSNGAHEEHSEQPSRLHIIHPPPPRNIRCLRRSITRLKGFREAQIEDIYLSSDSMEGEEDDARLNLSSDCPGCDPKNPMY